MFQVKENDTEVSIRIEIRNRLAGGTGLTLSESLFVPQLSFDGVAKLMVRFDELLTEIRKQQEARR
jgi:hypothetical protein